MTKLTLTIDNSANTKKLITMLKELDYIKKIETQQAEDNSLDSEELLMLEERIVAYEKNPTEGKSWESIRVELYSSYIN